MGKVLKAKFLLVITNIFLFYLTCDTRKSNPEQITLTPQLNSPEKQILTLEDGLVAAGIFSIGAFIKISPSGIDTPVRAVLTLKTSPEIVIKQQKNGGSYRVMTESPILGSTIMNTLNAGEWYFVSVIVDSNASQLTVKFYNENWNDMGGQVQSMTQILTLNSGDELQLGYNSAIECFDGSISGGYIQKGNILSKTDRYLVGFKPELLIFLKAVPVLSRSSAALFPSGKLFVKGKSETEKDTWPVPHLGGLQVFKDKFFEIEQPVASIPITTFESSIYTVSFVLDFQIDELPVGSSYLIFSFWGEKKVDVLMTDTGEIKLESNNNLILTTSGQISITIAERNILALSFTYNKGNTLICTLDLKNTRIEGEINLANLETAPIPLATRNYKFRAGNEGTSSTTGKITFWNVQMWNRKVELAKGCDSTCDVEIRAIDTLQERFCMSCNGSTTPYLKNNASPFKSECLLETDPKFSGAIKYFGKSITTCLAPNKLNSAGNICYECDWRCSDCEPLQTQNCKICQTEAGYFETGGVCLACATGCKICSGANSNQCSECKTQEGYYMKNGVCEVCEQSEENCKEEQVQKNEEENKKKSNLYFWTLSLDKNDNSRIILRSSVRRLYLNSDKSTKEEEVSLERAFTIGCENYPDLDINLKNDTKRIFFKINSKEKLKPSIYKFELKSSDYLIGPNEENAFNTYYQLNHPGYIPITSSRLAFLEDLIQLFSIKAFLCGSLAILPLLTTFLSFFIIGLLKLIQVIEFFSLLAFFSIPTHYAIKNLFKIIYENANYEFWSNPLSRLIPHTKRYIINNNFEYLQISPSLLQSTHLDLIIFLMISIIYLIKRFFNLEFEKSSWKYRISVRIHKLSSVLFLSYGIEYWTSVLMNLSEWRNLSDKKIGDYLSLIFSLLTLFLLQITLKEGIILEKITQKEKKKKRSKTEEIEPKEKEKDFQNISDTKEQTVLIGYDRVWIEFINSGLAKPAISSSTLRYYNFYSILKYLAFVTILIGFQTSGAAQLLLTLLIQLGFLVGTLMAHFKYKLFKNWYILTQSIVKETIQLIILLTLGLMHFLRLLKIFSQELSEAEIFIIYFGIFIGTFNEILYLILEIGFFIKKRCNKKNRVAPNESPKKTIQTINNQNKNFLTPNQNFFRSNFGSHRPKHGTVNLSQIPKRRRKHSDKIRRNSFRRVQVKDLAIKNSKFLFLNRKKKLLPLNEKKFEIASEKGVSSNLLSISSYEHSSFKKCKFRKNDKNEFKGFDQSDASKKKGSLPFDVKKNELIKTKKKKELIKLGKKKKKAKNKMRYGL